MNSVGDRVFMQVQETGFLNKGIDQVVNKVKAAAEKHNYSLIKKTFVDSLEILHRDSEPNSVSYLYQQQIIALCFLDFNENLDEIIRLKGLLEELKGFFPHNFEIAARCSIALNIFENRRLKNLESTNPYYPLAKMEDKDSVALLDECAKHLEDALSKVRDPELETEILFNLGLNALANPFKQLQAEDFFTNAAEGYSKVQNVSGQIQSMILRGLSAAEVGVFSRSIEHLLAAQWMINGRVGDLNPLHTCPVLNVYLYLTKVEALFVFFENPQMLSGNQQPIKTGEIETLIAQTYKEINDVNLLNDSKMETDYAYLYRETKDRLRYINTKIAVPYAI